MRWLQLLGTDPQARIGDWQRVVDRRSIPTQVRRRSAPTAERPRGLPHVYRGGSRNGRKATYESEFGLGSQGGGFRWLLSTCLAGGVGAIAILVVIYGSTDRSEQGGLMPALKRMRDGSADTALLTPRVEGLRWSVPKADKLQTMTGAMSTRFIIHDSLKVKKANREYIHAKPYARIVVRLAPVPATYTDVIPPFNPFKLYATEGLGWLRDQVFMAMDERQRFIRVAQHEQPFAMVPGKLVVNVNADDDADERDFFQMRTQGKITGSAKITDQCIKPLNVGIGCEHAREFFQQRIFAFVGEKPFGHCGWQFARERRQRQSAFKFIRQKIATQVAVNKW